jgi:hypothetical protein
VVRWLRSGFKLFWTRKSREHQGLAGPGHAEEAGEDEGIMPVIIDRAGRNFNADEMDGVSGRDRIMPAIIDQTGRPFNLDEADAISRRHRSRTTTWPTGSG